MIRKIRSGEVEELSVFPVGNATKPRRGRKKGSTTSRKQDENMRLAVRRLAQSINCNFGAGDLWLTLKYSDAKLARLERRIREDGLAVNEDTVRDYADAEMDRYIRRIKREYLKTAGKELLYIASTSDHDGDTGEAVRVHHHILFPKELFELAMKHWPRDFLNYRSMDSRKDHTAIAVYIIGQVKRPPDKKKYKVSKNLKKPVVVSEKLISVREEVRPPKGARVMENHYAEDKPTQYIRYIPGAEKKKRGGKRE